MNEEGRRALVVEELERADEELRAADQLLGAGFARIALARAYFAVFHAVRARLYADKLEPRSHSGAQHLFNLHFVKPGRYDPSVSRLMARLQKYREQVDYGHAFVVDQAGAREEIEAARALLERIHRDISS